MGRRVARKASLDVESSALLRIARIVEASEHPPTWKALQAERLRELARDLLAPPSSP